MSPDAQIMHHARERMARRISEADSRTGKYMGLNSIPRSDAMRKIS